MRSFVAIDVSRLAHDLALLGTVLHFVEPHARFVQRLQSTAFTRLRIFLRELSGERADFFRMILPDVLRE